MCVCKKLLSVLVLLFALPLTACSFLGRGPVGNSTVPEPAKSVDLEKYLGVWYEIARYEAPFQRGCDAVIAEYSLRSDGKIKVLNSCHRGSADAPRDQAEATAYVVEGSQNAKLRVSFFWPFFGNYWVLDHGETYDWSIVGEPSGRYLWFLFRVPRPSEALQEAVFSRAAQMGYRLDLLRITKQ